MVVVVKEVEKEEEVEVVKQVVKQVEKEVEKEELVDLHKNYQSHCCCSVLDNLQYIAWTEYFTLPHLFRADSARTLSCLRGQLGLYSDFTRTKFWLSNQPNFNS